MPTAASAALRAAVHDALIADAALASIMIDIELIELAGALAGHHVGQIVEQGKADETPGKARAENLARPVGEEKLGVIVVRAAGSAALAVLHMGGNGARQVMGVGERQAGDVDVCHGRGFFRVLPARSRAPRRHEYMNLR